MTFDKDDIQTLAFGFRGKMRKSNEIVVSTNSTVYSLVWLIQNISVIVCSRFYTQTMNAKANKKCCKHEYSIIYLTKSYS